MRTITIGGAVSAVLGLALGACHAPAANERGVSPERPDDEEHGAALAVGRRGEGEANGLGAVSAIAAGRGHSCAIVNGGEVHCWGSNFVGQLGDGTTTDRAVPVPVVQSPGGPPLAGARALVLNADHSCAIVGEGEAFCWGYNSSGQLGDGTTIDRHTPVPVLQSAGGPRLAGVQALGLGDYHTCALTVGGRVSCWGSNFIGQIGDGTTTDRPYPVPVVRSPGGPPLEGVQTLATGSHYGCVVVAGGRTLCWGDNSSVQLGDGTGVSQSTPVAVVQSPGGPPLAGVRALALGYGHSCAIVSAGHVLCWGLNSFGELGNGTMAMRLYPTPVVRWPGGPPLEGVQTLAVGYSFGNCVTVTGGKALCWGWNSSGQIGDGTTTLRLTPVPVLQSPGGPPLAGVQALAAGSNHSCATVSGGDVLCWGRNSSGQIGDGTTIDRLTPVAVAFP